MPVLSGCTLIFVGFLILGPMVLLLVLAIVGIRKSAPTLTPPPRLKGVDLKLRVVRYTQPDMWVSPLYWGHLIMCHACGLSFRVEMGSPHGWIRCPKCYTEERAALVIEEWQNRVIHKQFPPVEIAP